MALRSPLSLLVPVCVVTLAMLASREAAACATCFGVPGDAQTEGMNAAIWTLLGVTSGVLGIAGAFLGALLWRMRGLS